MPPAADAVTMRGLARDPADRFDTAFAMAEALVRAIPPALPTEVGAWVAEVAHEGLARRAAQLDAIESYSSTGVPVTPEAPAPRAGPEATAARTDGVPATAVSPAPPASRRSGWSPVGTLSVLGAVVVVGFAVALLRAPAGAATAPAAAGSSSADVRGDPPPPPAAVQVEPPPSVPSGSPATGSSATTSAPSSSPKATGRSGRPRKPNCNPPYTLDPIGVRVPKPGCY